MPTTVTPLWPRKLMSFQARAQKAAMWPASCPTRTSASSSIIWRTTCVRRLLSVKTRFSTTPPASSCTKTRMQPNEWIVPNALPIGCASRTTTGRVCTRVIFMCDLARTSCATSHSRARDLALGITRQQRGIGVAAEARPLRHAHSAAAGAHPGIERMRLHLEPQHLDQRSLDARGGDVQRGDEAGAEV